MKRTITAIALLALLAALPIAAAKKRADKDNDGARMKAETFKGLELRGIGPALTAGRISDIAIHPEDQSTWYVAAGSGGIWKTTNAGTTWKPIFDDQGSYSIGCITIDPNHPETVWVGTGENVGGRHVGYGDGVYKQPRRRRAHGTNVGLDETEHIGSASSSTRAIRTSSTWRPRVRCGLRAATAACSSRPTAAEAGRRSSAADNTPGSTR